ncbi:MAG: family 10 glycosylhydrolase [Lachnospiraceae bacterium]|nr:family 10 glycosylhydrolase [Lachnospiraceae bacterium]
MKSTKFQRICSLALLLTLLIAVWKGTLFIPDQLSNTVDKQEVIAQSIDAGNEMRAVWISYLEFSGAKMSNMSKNSFQSYINKLFTNTKNLGLNTVIVQVRPMGDALYASSYFPWSTYASGKQGKSPGYDPLAYMVKAAHNRGLKIHAWLNPYRVTITGTNVKALSSNNQARKWRSSSSSSKKRNVLTFNGALYYNPAKSDVQNLIVNGVKEIVQNYDVDGIHFDDYFYPTLGNKYKSNFDAKEYKSYVKRCKQQKKNAKSIVSWRRSNINNLIKKVYKGIKSVDKDVEFGVSPAGNISNLYASDRYYVDVKTWMKSSDYVDYICPQIYWSFTHSICPYTNTVKQWAALKKNNKVDLYIGLAAYRAGISKTEARAIGDTGWTKSKQELKKQVVAGRKVNKVDGFVFYRYDNLFSSKLKQERTNLKKVLK